MTSIELQATEPAPGRGRLVLTAAWIALRLLLVFYLGRRGVLFFYQAF